MSRTLKRKDVDNVHRRKCPECGRSVPIVYIPGRGRFIRAHREPRGHSCLASNTRVHTPLHKGREALPQFSDDVAAAMANQGECLAPDVKTRADAELEDIYRRLREVREAGVTLDPTED